MMEKLTLFAEEKRKVEEQFGVYHQKMWEFTTCEKIMKESNFEKDAILSGAMAWRTEIESVRK